MAATYTKKAQKLYRYYQCREAWKRGLRTCPTKSISSAKVEKFVVDRLREIGKQDGMEAFAVFGDLWEDLFPKERERLLRLVVERVEYDAAVETLDIVLSPSGIAALAEEMEGTAGRDAG